MANGKAWTKGEETILLAHYETGGPVACQRQGLNRSRDAIEARAKKRGIRANPELMNARKENREPAWALPRHDPEESLDCVRLRNWRYPVERGRVLSPAIGVAA